MTPAGLRGITWDHERGTDPLLATAERFAAETGIPVTWDVRSLQGFADASIPDLAQRYDLLVLRPSAPRRDRPDRSAPRRSTACSTTRSSPTRPPTRSGRATRATSGTATCGALAIDAAGHVSAYRPDLLERLGVGVPETWDDVWELDRVARPQGMRPRLPHEGGRHARHLAHARSPTPAPSPTQDEERILPRDVGARAARDARAAGGDVAPGGVRLEPDPPARAHGRPPTTSSTARSCSATRTTAAPASGDSSCSSGRSRRPASGRAAA